MMSAHFDQPIVKVYRLMNEAPGSRRFMKGLSLNSPYYDLGDCTATSFFHIIRSKFNKLFLKGSVLSGELFLLQHACGYKLQVTFWYFSYVNHIRKKHSLS